MTRYWARTLWFAFISLLLIGSVSSLKQSAWAWETSGQNRILGEPSGEQWGSSAVVSVEGVGTIRFDPTQVRSKRPELFQEGHFSLFDVLVHLHQKGHFTMEYHFDESLNTYVIDALNGSGHWWYSAYYDGGWPERSVFRMDHYPYKDAMVIQFRTTSPEFLAEVYQTYRDEVKRRQQSGGRVVIPTVELRGRTFTKRFDNVEVIAHNLRNDVFVEGTVTAIDVILTLGAAGLITYELQWYDSIGTADIVRSYWVNGINGDSSEGRFGFVYEAGSPSYRFFRGNHNHIPSDIRVINAPEYLEYFWICI